MAIFKFSIFLTTLTLLSGCLETTETSQASKPVTSASTNITLAQIVGRYRSCRIASSTSDEVFTRGNNNCRKSTLHIKPNGKGTANLYDPFDGNNPNRQGTIVMTFGSPLGAQIPYQITETRLDRVKPRVQNRSGFAVIVGKSGGIRLSEKHPSRETSTRKYPSWESSTEYQRINADGSTYTESRWAEVLRNGEINAEKIRQSRQAAAAVGAVIAAAQSSATTTGQTSTSAPRQIVPNGDHKTKTPPPFVHDSLRDFEVSSPNIQICVWDYACEDGDRVTLKIHGSSSSNDNITLFSNQILTNEPICKNVNISRATGSKNASIITLTANNGSGNIGQCSYANANTGKMSVSGGGGQDTWSLRGGAGTSATLSLRK